MSVNKDLQLRKSAHGLDLISSFGTKLSMTSSEREGKKQSSIFAFARLPTIAQTVDDPLAAPNNLYVVEGRRELMFKAIFFSLCTAALLSLSLFAVAQTPIRTGEAKDRVGEVAVVCGDVADTYFIPHRGNPTFINLDREYENRIFSVVVWGKQHPKFLEPDRQYLHRRICVTGTITLRADVPEIVVDDPSQIRIMGVVR